MIRQQKLYKPAQIIIHSPYLIFLTQSFFFYFQFKVNLYELVPYKLLVLYELITLNLKGNMGYSGSQQYKINCNNFSRNLILFTNFQIN